MKIKNICMIFLLALMQLMFLISDSNAAQKVLIATYKDNTDYSTVRRVFVSELKLAVKELGMEVEFAELIDVHNRQEFIRSLREQVKDVDMIFTAGTPNAMAIKEAGINIPVLFGAVADPKRAHLLKSFQRPDSNFTGVFCAVAAHTQLQTLLKVLPNIKTLGILYNPNDPAPVSQVKSWHQAVSQVLGIKIIGFHIPQSVNSEEALAEVTKGMMGLVDVIVTTADAQVASYGKGIIEVANEHNMPTYFSLRCLVKEGGLVSLGFNFEEATRIVNVPQAIKILQGIPTKAIPVGTYQEYKLSVNLKTAQRMGVVFPQEIIDLADEIIK